jgi:hypothetical protein
MKPSTKSNGVLNTGRPPHSVAYPAENLDSGGNSDHHARRGEEALAEVRQARREHVVDPQSKRENGIRNNGKDKAEIAEHGPLRESGNDRRYHSSRRKEDRVDLRMTEEPIEVLPQQRVAPD